MTAACRCTTSLAECEAGLDDTGDPCCPTCDHTTPGRGPGLHAEPPAHPSKSKFRDATMAADAEPVSYRGRGA